MYYIWLDESDKEGEFYSNFYGGILIKSEDLDNVLRMMSNIVEELEIKEEIKWQKVNAFYLERYKKIVEFIFDLLRTGLVKIRIFFRNNQYQAVGLTNEQKKHIFPLLYYQFIKHYFGLQYSNNTWKPLYVSLLLDDIPLKGEDKETFKNFLSNLSNDAGFKKANVIIRKDDIYEVNSSKHIPLQFMDLILGSICFRLNNKHKVKDSLTNKRGKRTVCKEKLYKFINMKIRELKPGFNIGESTGIQHVEDRWNMPYSHWSFKSSNYIRDFSKSKKNSPKRT